MSAASEPQPSLVRFHAGWARGRGGLVAFVAVMVALALLWAADRRSVV